MPYGDDIEHLPIEQMRYGHLYRLASRNLACGVWDGRGGFVGVREKFGQLFLDVEYHWDQGAPYGTAHPLEDLGAMPRRLDAATHYPPIDQQTGRLVDLGMDDENDITSCYWFFVDTGERSDKIHSHRRLYRPLFDWLLKAEIDHDLLGEHETARRQTVLDLLDESPATYRQLVDAIKQPHQNAEGAWSAHGTIARMRHAGLIEADGHALEMDATYRIPGQ
jgi:hypothetical protein